MRHLAARFMRHSSLGHVAKIINADNAVQSLPLQLDPIYVLDPLLNFSDRLKNETALNQNLEARRIVKNLSKIHKDYIDWWNIYEQLSSCPKVNKEEEPEKWQIRNELRQKLQDNSAGLLAALALPNYLYKPKYGSNQGLIEQAFSQRCIEEMGKISQKISGTHITSLALLQRTLRSSMIDLAKRVLKPILFSGPLLVRPAIVQCCNISLDRFPVVTDGLDPPLCLVGIDLPCFLPILIKRQFTEKNNHWPAILMASGPSYQTFSDGPKFRQNELINFLVLARNEDECAKAHGQLRELLTACLHEFVNAEQHFEEVQPEKLHLWESSAVAARWAVEGVGIAELARLSNIGEYVSKRGQIVFGKGATHNEWDDQQKYIHLAFSSLNLSSLAQYLLTNNNG